MSKHKSDTATEPTAITVERPVHEITFVAIGPYAWGKGATVSAAVKACKANLSRSYGGAKQKITTYRVERFQYVSDMGSIVYLKDETGGSIEKVDEIEVAVR